jgi:2-oxoisovalerate dehydrogenase E1 component
MYNGKVNCPVVFRTPMGGKRGYGPTHSQTLDKFLCGIDNVKTIALNVFINPIDIYEKVHNEKHPVIVIENKTDYGKKIGSIKQLNYKISKNAETYPVVKASPLISKPNLTIVTYGSNGNWIIENLQTLFVETEKIVEVILLTKINPIDYTVIMKSVNTTHNLLVVEEGSKYFGIGSEIIAGVMERIDLPIKAKRIGAIEVPIPSVKSLENIVLPSLQNIIEAINN